MSGGSLNYIYLTLENAAAEISSHYNDEYCPLHGNNADRQKWELTKRFVEKLDHAVKALHAVEWVMSGDYGEGDEFTAIERFLS